MPARHGFPALPFSELARCDASIGRRSEPSGYRLVRGRGYTHWIYGPEPKTNSNPGTPGNE